MRCAEVLEQIRINSTSFTAEFEDGNRSVRGCYYSRSGIT